MKNSGKYLIGSIFVLSLLLVNTYSSAMRLSVGSTAWFTWWEPALEGSLTQEYNPNVTYREFSMDPSFLVGPVLSLDITNSFSISTLFLYGEWFNGKGQFHNVSIFDVEVSNLKRFDSDTVANYRLIEYLNLFVGLKVQGYSFDFARYQNGVFQAQFNANFFSIGPGAGFGLTVPIVDTLFLLFNFSGIYMRVNFRNPVGDHEFYNAWGFNSSLSLAYFFNSVNTTVALGFRCQYLYYYFDAGATIDNVTDWSSAYADETDIFYGITLTAMYTFNFLD